MGWGRTLLLGDVGNRLDIADCEQDVQSLRQALAGLRQGGHDLDMKVMALQRENDELKLYVAALIRMLTARGVVDKAEIQRMVKLIDAEDGVVDGRARGEVL